MQRLRRDHYSRRLRVMLMKPARKPPPIPPPLERDVQRTAMTLIATSWPWLRVMRLNSGKVKTATGSWIQLAPTGTPDVLVLLPHGKCVWLEFKRKGEVQSDAQRAWEAHATSELGHAVVVCETAEAALAAVRSKLYGH